MDLDHRRESFFPCACHLSWDFEWSGEESTAYDIHLWRADICPEECICRRRYRIHIIDDTAGICCSSEICMWYPRVHDAISTCGKGITALHTSHLNLSEASCECCSWIADWCSIFGILDIDVAEIGPLKTIIGKFFYEIEIADSFFSEVCTSYWENRWELHRSGKSSIRSIIETQSSVLPVGHIISERFGKCQRSCPSRGTDCVPSHACFTIITTVHTADIESWSTSGVISISIL